MAKQKVEQEERLDQEEQHPVEKQEEEQPEKLNRRECAERVIAEVDGDTTLKEMAEKADKLFVAGRGGDSDHSDLDTAAWHIQKVLETLEGVGLVELSWECVIHPNVPKLGLPKK